MATKEDWAVNTYTTMKASLLTCQMSKGGDFVNKFEGSVSEYWDVVACGLMGRIQTF
jgi:hypothetical protein